MKKRILSTVISFCAVFAVYYLADYFLKGVLSNGVAGEMIAVIVAVSFSDFLYKEMNK